MILITKRNGTVEPLNEEKYNRVVMWATEGVKGVSASAVALGASASIVTGMTTSEVHDALIKSAADIISADHPNYSQVAARLSIFKIRKDANGQYEFRTSPATSARTSHAAFMTKRSSRSMTLKRSPLWVST